MSYLPSSFARSTYLVTVEFLLRAAKLIWTYNRFEILSKLHEETGALQDALTVIKRALPLMQICLGGDHPTMLRGQRSIDRITAKLQHPHG